MNKKQTVNTKEMLMCVLFFFKQLGIDYVDPKDFISAKQNKELETDVLIRLLFDLSLLHMFDYDIDLKALDLQASEQDRITVVLVHLIESQCPLLVDIHQTKSQGLNFESSRVLIMVAGWIMAVSDFFGRVGEYIIKKAQKKSKQPLTQHIPKSLQKQKGLQVKSQITILCKSIRAVLSNVNNLKKKKLNLRQKISNILKQSGQTISISQFLSNDEQQEKREFERLKMLIQYIQNQKTYMRFRNHFWAWLENVIKRDKQEIEDHPDYQFEAESESAITRLSYNTDALSDFMEEMKVTNSLMKQFVPIFQQINRTWKQRQGKATESQKKQIHTLSKVVVEELNKFLPNYYEQSNHLQANSFIGIELKQMFYEEEERLIHKEQDTGEYERTVELCHKNMQSLHALKFI